MKQAVSRNGWSLECGVEWRIEDGLLDLRMNGLKIPALVEGLRKIIRAYAGMEVQTVDTMDRINRASRMCWEALHRKTVSGLDSLDCEVLYDIETSEDNEWVFKVLNPVRGSEEISNAYTPPDAGDRYAKSVAAVMGV